jgi:outer membrane protein assembly factor BamD (BamD/ComL family)
MKHSQPSSTALFRVVAVAVLFLTTIGCGLLVLGALDHGDSTVPVPALYAPAVLTAIGGIALATLLEGIVQVIIAVGEPHESTDLTPAISRLLLAVNDLKTSLPQILASVAPAPQAPQPADEEGVPGSTIEQHMLRMVQLLEEMKDMSMLDDDQRRTRRVQQLARRKVSRLAEAARFINNQDWPQADSLLHLMESLYPGDADVLALRTQLEDARNSIQTQEWDTLKQQVNDLLALSRYDEAVSMVMQFLERFPTHAPAQQMSVRVKQEQTAYAEGVSNRLYEEIKSAVENRRWRVALDAIQSFLVQYPDHTRAAKIRQQLRVIQKNAEIEERHEQEERIRTLINDKQFAEAADLREDLLQRFPDSPQAAYLADLLPKLRERSTIEQADAISG